MSEKDLTIDSEIIDEITEGKEDKEIKGESLPICRCITNDLHANNVPQNSKGNLGLSQGRI